jgi:transposase
VSQTIPIIPEHCARCQQALPAEPGSADPEPTRFQVAELREVKATIIEYQGHARTCPGCGEVTRAPISAAIRAHNIGPGLAALLSYLVGACGLSKRRVEELVEAVFEVPVALGTIAKLEQEMSAALAPAHQEALAAVREAPVKHADETGWKKAGRKRWL